MTPKIIYTKTDEAPALATYSLLPIIQAFIKTAHITIEVSDISLAGRILAAFPDKLAKEQRVPAALSELGKIVKNSDANIIKLPNISASIPQIKMAIKELQRLGYAIPDYPEKVQSSEDKDIKNRFNLVKGSAVNPVLREGNSDRRAPRSVKNYAKNNPHAMSEWSSSSKSHVASMQHGDFYASEKSLSLKEATQARIVFSDAQGKETLLKEKIPLLSGEIIDSAVMNIVALQNFVEGQISDAREKNLLFSLHLKATMMKVSDPIIFGYVVKVFFKDLLDKHQDSLSALGFNANNGIGDLEEKIPSLPQEKQEEIRRDLAACYKKQPELAMVNSEKGISNLHVPSDIIIDASMPAAIRSAGKMWGNDGTLKDMKALIPDRCYAGIYQSVIDFCKQNGAFNPTTMGSVSNVGLMAQKAEEYGSHDKTFPSPGKGKIRVLGSTGDILLEQSVEEGDIFRLCQVKDAPIKNWISLALDRVRTSGDPAIFWLDKERAHDVQLIKKVENYLSQQNLKNLEIHIMPPQKACQYTLERIQAGKNTISVTGNVLRDYLTDLFPILELGTSAKMLSIVPLMNGGGLFETGAGGSAPKHVQQFFQEGHLRWDSLGEFLALSVSLEHLSKISHNPKALILSETLEQAIEKLLENNKSPSRKTGELDNRGSHFYLALYWAQALAKQGEEELSQLFTPTAEALEKNEEGIIQEINASQGRPVDIGGYYYPEKERVEKIMRPSKTFNQILSEVNA